MSLIKGEKFLEREDDTNNQTRIKRVSLESRSGNKMKNSGP